MPSGAGAGSAVALDLSDRLVFDVRRGIVAQQRGNRAQCVRLLEDALRMLADLRDAHRPGTPAEAEAVDDLCDYLEEGLQLALDNWSSELTSACLAVAADLRRTLGTSFG